MSNRRMPRLQGLDAFCKRLKRKVGIGTRHTRECNFKRQPRIHRIPQLYNQISQHAEYASQAIGRKQGALFHKRTLGSSAKLHWCRFARKREHVHVAHMYRQLARKGLHIAARFHKMRRPRKTSSNIALANGAHKLGHVGGIG